ncbi:tyrosine-type recombinase/integrase [Streptomyces solincola]|uniref:tyrosine-type recombinase/integrase n=1 Tax=Streptomyces solincola TaxID=2100817 RepID=UPI001C616AF9|nr:site-specific integrase [Streptomyces solincola]
MGLTLQEARLSYQEAMRAAKVPFRTQEQYGQIVKRLERQYPNRHFAGIKTSDLYDFLYGEDGILLGRAAKTGVSYRAALRSFFAYGQGRGWTKTVTVVPQPPFKASGPKPEWNPTRLNEAELIQLLGRADHPVLRGMVAVAIGTALRVSDICKIQVMDVNLNAGDLYVWVKKTGRFDAMPITLDLEEELRRYLRWYTAETGATLQSGSAYLFPGWQHANDGGVLGWVPDTSRPCDYAWASRHLSDLYSECGISVQPRERWHVIRRSVARIYFDMLRNDVSYDHALRQVSALLGHLNSKTTETYLGLDAERRARDASLRGRRFISAAAGNVVSLPGRKIR